MFCHVGDAIMWAVCQAWPQLQSLIVKEDQQGGIGNSGLAAASCLSDLTALGVSVVPATDVRPLAGLTQLRYLLLDGRSNAEVFGAKALIKLQHLKTLVLPLLHLHHEKKGTLVALQTALPDTLIANITGNFGVQYGCHWFGHFSESDREWWRHPEAPWAWHPTLHVSP